MNITYEKNGDYLIPNLISDPEPEEKLRKFGLMRRHYLKEHWSGIYQAMLLSGKLKEHLLMMQEQAETHFPHPIHSATFPPPRSRNRSRDFCYNKQPFRKCKPETGQSSIFL